MSGRPPTRAPRATTPDDGRARSLWREIVDDPFALGAFAAGLVILATPWLVPMTRAAWGAGLDLLLLLPIVLAIFTFGIGTPSGRRERLFWRLIAGAAASWWLAALLAYPGLAWVDRGATTYGLLIAAAYLALLLALETRPDLSRRLSLPERLDVLSDLVLVAGLFAYFMWRPEPSAVEPAALSRQVLHLTLDCVLTVRFAGLALSLPAHRRRWRALYGSLAAVGIGFAIFNIAPLVLEVDGFGWPPWTTRLPMIAGVAALGTVARLRRRHLPADDRVPQPRFSSLFLAYAFLFPMLHFGLSRLGVLDPVLQPTREWIVLGAIGLLGLLAILEQNLLRQRSAYLEERHRRDMRQAEEREQFSSSLIEHSPLAIVVLDAQHKVKLINPAFQQLFGFDPQEVEGASLDDLIATSRTADEAADYTRRVLAGAAVHRVARRRRKDGQEVDVEIHGVPLLVDGDLVGVVAIYQDITERLRTEQARSESEQRFRLLSDATFEGIVLSDDRMVMDCNTQFARIAGRRPDEIVGLPVLNFVAPEDQARVSDAMRRGLDRPYEHLLVTGTGELRTVEVHARSIGYGGRQVRVAAVRDITEARRWEQEERQAQKMEAVGRLAGGIAHDFNNVLTVIKGYGQLLALQLGEGRAREHVREINQAADRAGLMTQRLLAFGRKQALQPTILDLSAVVRGMEQMLRRLIRADIDLEVDTSGDAGRVQADPGQIEQVILNLAINARDAMPRGGRLRIATHRQTLERAEPPHPAGDYVVLEVSDDGVGMSEQIRRQVFDPFFTTKGKDQGTGLGLATVYAIVQQTGGTIDVESAPDQGSLFRVLLPQAAELPDSAAPRPTTSHLPRGDEMVLVVEDEPGVRSLAVEFLRSHGYRVTAAADGREALKLLDTFEEPVDLVLTDVIMPGINGPEVAERYVQRHPATKVLFMSGYTDEVLGWDEPTVAARLVQKPFSIEDLVTKVRETLDEGGTKGLAGDLARRSDQQPHSEARPDDEEPVN